MFGIGETGQRKHDGGGEDQIAGEVRESGRQTDAEVVDQQAGGGVIWTGATNEINNILGVSQRRQVRRRNNDQVIRRQEGLLDPAIPLMRKVEHDERRGASDSLKHFFENIWLVFVDVIQCGRSGEQTKAFCAPRCHAIEERRVKAIWLVQSVNDPLNRVLIEVQPRRSKCKIKVCDNSVHLDLFGEREGDVVCER